MYTPYELPYVAFLGLVHDMTCDMDMDIDMDIDVRWTCTYFASHYILQRSTAWTMLPRQRAVLYSTIFYVSILVFFMFYTSHLFIRIRAIFRFSLYSCASRCVVCGVRPPLWGVE